MKKILYLMAASIALFLSCQHPDPVRDALLARAGNLAVPREVTYDAVNSTDRILAVYWNATAALDGGAVSFTVQVSTDAYFFDGDGGSLISRQILVSDSPNDAIMVTGLTAGESYFLRVAAVYPGPARSEWVYLSGADGKPVAVIPGSGLVEE